jgi:tRNA threonylcarbamoyladenosine biosynthesis protein TsaB
LAVGWYQATRDGWQSANDIEVLTIQKLSGKITQPTMVCGEFTAEERQLLGRKRVNVILSSPAQSLRRPSYLAELGWRRWQAGQVDDPASLSPNYLQYPESA